MESQTIAGLLLQTGRRGKSRLYHVMHQRRTISIGCGLRVKGLAQDCKVLLGDFRDKLQDREG